MNKTQVRVRNPETGRLVSLNGKIGKKLVKENTSTQQPRPRRKITRQQKGGMTCADGRICNADCCPSDNFDNESWKCCPIDD